MWVTGEVESEVRAPEDELLAHLLLPLLQALQVALPPHGVRLGEAAGLALLVALLEAHLLEPVLPVELVVPGVRGVAQVLHVRPDEHLTQAREVAVVLVLHLDSGDRVARISIEQVIR